MSFISLLLSKMASQALEVKMSHSELIKRTLIAISCGVVIAFIICVCIVFILVTLSIPQKKFLR